MYSLIIVCAHVYNACYFHVECRTLPAKSAAEEKRHQKLYEEMITAARRKGEIEPTHTRPATQFDLFTNGVFL